MKYGAETLRLAEESRQAIVRTIAFFDLFDYPLTAREIHEWTAWPGAAPEYLAVCERLRAGWPGLGRQAGYFFIAGREETIIRRRQRYHAADRKRRRAGLAARLFSLLPWVKAVFLGNAIGRHNLKDGGDIDLFIITAARRLWLARLWCAALMKLLGQRPRPGRERDKICLSFFVSEDALDLRALMLTAGDRAGADIYFLYWLAGLTPLFYRGETTDFFWQANAWLKKILPAWRPCYPLVKASRGAARGRAAGPGGLFGRLEAFAAKLQIRLLPARLKEVVNRDTRVVAGPDVIKLHANDRREEYRESYCRRLKQLGLPGA